MFVNISNHPSSKWSAEQKAAAQHLSRECSGDDVIVDIAFPNVPPTASLSGVKQLVLETIRHLPFDPEAVENHVVHIMGEAGFVHSFLSMMEFMVVLVHSTTERTVQDVGGKKVVEFKFIQFRQY